MKNKRPKLAVFASGRGSNFEAMLKDEELREHIVLLVCDVPNAKVVDIANEYGVDSFVFEPKQYPNKASYEQEIQRQIEGKDVELIVLAGYMLIIGETLLIKYEGKIMNVHPSYLPAFPGKDAIGQAMRAKASSTGVTVHFVDSGIDTGPIIEQEKVDIDAKDTLQSLTEKIQRVEHRLYPKVIKQVMEDLR